MSDDDIIKLKIIISMNSSTSFVECDRLFITEFLTFDRVISDKIRREIETYKRMNING